MTKLDKNFDIVLGNERDICFYCLQEHHKLYPEQDVLTAKKELGGQLLNKPIYRNRKIGEGFVICKHHIGNILCYISACDAHTDTDICILD